MTPWQHVTLIDEAFLWSWHTSHVLTPGAAADASHTPVTLPHPSPHHRAPTPHTPCSASTHTPCSATTYTPCSASTVSCPPFNGSLTRAELRPAILRALEIHKPNSQSALDLSKMLWPENTPMRKAMNTMVTATVFLMHVDTCRTDAC